MTDTSRPQVRAWPWLRGYQGHFRKPGGGWQFVRIKGGKQAQIFPTAEAAKDAARELVFDFLCPPIVAARLDTDPVEVTIADEVAEFKRRRADEERRIRTETFTMHKAGKKPVVVETRKRKTA